MRLVVLTKRELPVPVEFGPLASGLTFSSRRCALTSLRVKSLLAGCSINTGLVS